MTLDYSKLPEWAQWVLLIGAILTALGVIFVVLRRAWPAFAAFVGALSRFVSTMNALADLPQFMTTTAATLADQDVKIARIDHQIHENGGGSLKDAVVEVKKTLGRNTARLSRIEKGVAGLYVRVDQHETDAAEDRKNIAEARKEIEDRRPSLKPKGTTP